MTVKSPRKMTLCGHLLIELEDRFVSNIFIVVVSVFIDFHSSKRKYEE